MCDHDNQVISLTLDNSNYMDWREALVCKARPIQNATPWQRSALHSTAGTTWSIQVQGTVGGGCGCNRFCSWHGTSFSWLTELCTENKVPCVGPRSRKYVADVAHIASWNCYSYRKQTDVCTSKSLIWFHVSVNSVWFFFGLRHFPPTPLFVTATGLETNKAWSSPSWPNDTLTSH